MAYSPGMLVIMFAGSPNFSPPVFSSFVKPAHRPPIV